MGRVGGSGTLVTLGEQDLIFQLSSSWGEDY